MPGLLSLAQRQSLPAARGVCKERAAHQLEVEGVGRWVALRCCIMGPSAVDHGRRSQPQRCLKSVVVKAEVAIVLCH